MYFKNHNEKVVSLDVVTSILDIFHLDIYTMHDPSAALFFLTAYLSMRVYVLPDVLLYSLFISSVLGESITTKRV